MGLDPNYVARGRLESRRKFWKYLVFGFLTVGIYCIYYLYCLVKDLNEACRPAERTDQDRSKNFFLVMLLTVLTFSVYFYIWIYRQGNRIKRAGEAYQIPIDEGGWTYFLWGLLGTLFFGVGQLVMYYLLTVNVNKLAEAYNRRYVDGGGSVVFSRITPPTPSDRKEDKNSSSIDVSVDLLAKRQIIAKEGEYKGVPFPLQEKEELVIGRSGQYSQIVLSNPTIGRRHCSIRYSRSDNNYYVTALSQVGRTRLNDSMTLPPNVEVKCPPGSMLFLGDGSNRFLLI